MPRHLQTNLNFRLYLPRIPHLFITVIFETPYDSFIPKKQRTAAELGKNIGVEVKNDRQETDDSYIIKCKYEWNGRENRVSAIANFSSSQI